MATNFELNSKLVGGCSFNFMKFRKISGNFKEKKGKIFENKS